MSPAAVPRLAGGLVEGELPGLTQNDEAPDTYTVRALGTLFRSWLESGNVPDDSGEVETRERAIRSFVGEEPS